VRALAVIPSRYASTRFPGKPLAPLAGKPMVRHVWERCQRAAGVDGVIVATEDERVVDACRSFGADVELTWAAHASGTDRVAEVARRHPDFEIVLKVQGDVPTISPDTIGAVVSALREGDAQIATPITPLSNVEDLISPNVVKVVTALNGTALYFSRSPIPFYRDAGADSPLLYHRHIGLYGFRRDALLRVAELSPSPLERAESLEQLRWLQSGFSIHCVLTSRPSIGVDTPEDLKALEASLRS